MRNLNEIFFFTKRNNNNFQSLTELEKYTTLSCVIKKSTPKRTKIYLKKKKNKEIHKISHIQPVIKNFAKSTNEEVKMQMKRHFN